MSVQKGKHPSHQSGFRGPHVPSQYHRVPSNQPGPNDGGSSGYAMNVNAAYQQQQQQGGSGGGAGGPQQGGPPLRPMHMPPHAPAPVPAGAPPHAQQPPQHPTPTSTPPSATDPMAKPPNLGPPPQLQQQTMIPQGYNQRVPGNAGVYRMGNPNQSRIQPSRNLVQVTHVQPPMPVTGYQPPINNLAHLPTSQNHHYTMQSFGQTSGRPHAQGSSQYYPATLPMAAQIVQHTAYPNTFFFPHLANAVNPNNQFIHQPVTRTYAGNATGQILSQNQHPVHQQMNITTIPSQSLMQPQSIQQPPTNYQQKKRSHAIPIIDPDTMKEIVTSASAAPGGSSTTPPISTPDSSARQTPQPGGVVSQEACDTSVAAAEQQPSFQHHRGEKTSPGPPAASGPPPTSQVTNGPNSLDISETQTVPISEVKPSKPQVASSPVSVSAAAVDKATVHMTTATPTQPVASSNVNTAPTPTTAPVPVVVPQEKPQLRDNSNTPVVSAATAGDEIQPSSRTIINANATTTKQDQSRDITTFAQKSQTSTTNNTNNNNQQSPSKNLSRKQSRGPSESSSSSSSEKQATVVQPPPTPTQSIEVVSINAKKSVAPVATAAPVEPSAFIPLANKKDVEQVVTTAAAATATVAVKDEPPSKDKAKPSSTATAVVKESAASVPKTTAATPPVPAVIAPVAELKPAATTASAAAAAAVGASTTFPTKTSFLEQISFKPQAVNLATVLPTPAAAPESGDSQATKAHTNGEIPVESSEGKANQRHVNKKNKKNINSKGIKKEGTEMDAFTENSHEEKTTPPPAPTPVTALNNKLPASDVPSKDDLQEKLVAAKNEENIKVSALSKGEGENNNTSSAPIIEKTQPPAQAQQPVLKHKYKEDQWSPLNPDGKKKYDRDFLMGLQNDPQATKKPDNLPNIDIVQLDPPHRYKYMNQNSSYSTPTRGGGGHGHDFVPQFFKSNSMRGPLPKRNSQQGNKSGKPTGKTIHVSTSLREDKRMKDSENAWKPTRLKDAKDITEEDKKTQELYKKVRSILNKLTPQKFDTLVSQVRKLTIDTPERLEGVINLVFDKAIAEPGYSKAYANMCKLVSNMEVKDSSGEKNDSDKSSMAEKKVVFRKLLIQRCQAEFESNKNAELSSEKRLKEIEECTDVEKKRELQLSYEEEERRIRKKSVGNIRFIGELYILDMLTASIMHGCINQLLKQVEEEPLECLCKLLTTIGKKLEQATLNVQNTYKGLMDKNEMPDLDQYFVRMKELSVKSKDSKVSSRVRFMLQDVIDLKQNNWVPRRDENNPKTMEQIQREANRESLEVSHAIALQHQQGHRKQDMRGGSMDDRRGGGGGGGRNRSMNQDDKDGGWQSVERKQSYRQQQPYTMDSNRVQMLKQQTDDTKQLKLGSSSLFGNWSRGANANKSADNKDDRNIVASFNMYEPLYRDERKQQPSIGSKLSSRITPSPSMEKERTSQPPSSKDDRSSQRRGPLSQPSSRDHTPTPNAGGRSTTLTAKPTPASTTAPAATAVATTAAAAASTVAKTPQEIKRAAIATLEEFIDNKNIEEACSSIEEFTTQNDQMGVVKEMLDYSFSHTETIQGLGKLLVDLVKGEVLTAVPVVLAVFDEYLADTIEYETWIDSPKIFQYFSEVIVPLVQSSLLSFSNIADICKRHKDDNKEHIKKLMAIIINRLIEECSEEWVKNKWISAEVSPFDFGFEPTKAEDQKTLEFLLSAKGNTPPTSSLMPMNEIQTKLVGFLQNSMNHEEICDWIYTNVGQDVEKPAFISALITAICEVSLDSMNKPSTLKTISLHANLIRKYVSSTNEDLEIQCLRTVAAFDYKLQHPQGLLVMIFDYLWDSNLISQDAFIGWKESDVWEDGKGTALKSLVSFFTSVTEAVESDGAS